MGELLKPYCHYRTQLGVDDVKHITRSIDTMLYGIAILKVMYIKHCKKASCMHFHLAGPSDFHPDKDTVRLRIHLSQGPATFTMQSSSYLQSSLLKGRATNVMILLKKTT